MGESFGRGVGGAVGHPAAHELAGGRVMGGVDFGCAVTTCCGHDTPEAAYQHWARTVGVPIRPRPADDDRAYRESVREDEARDWNPA